MTDRPQLTEAEMAVWQDRAFMPLKQRVWSKLESHLLTTLDRLREYEGNQYLPREWLLTPGKISRGENYQDYAYRVLDFPRFSEGENLVLFRTMLLWGHPVGVHLICTGDLRKPVMDRLISSDVSLSGDWYYSQQADPWQWESEDEHLLAWSQLRDIDIKADQARRLFFKVSRFLPVDEYERLSDFAEESWAELVRAYTRNSRTG